jgi:hypothetical protein
VAKSKISKYVIHGARHGGFENIPAYTVWWARVPWGTFTRFESWQEAATWLALRYQLKQENKPYRRGF